MPIIDMQATGANIKKIMKQNNFTVAQVQDRFGFHTPQAIYKWLRGDAMPTIDNFVVLAHLFGVKIDDMLAVK